MAQSMISLIKKYHASYGGVPIACWVHIILVLLNAIAIGICFFLSLYFVDVLNFNMISVGLLMSSYGFGTVAGGVISGKLCDNLSPNLIGITSLLVQSAAFLSLSIFNTFNPLFITLFGLGLSSYSFKTSNSIAMMTHCQDKDIRSKATNISYAASNFGLGISGVIISIVIHSYTIIFHAASYLLIFSALCLMLFNKTAPALPRLNIEKHMEGNHTPHKKILFLALLSTLFIGMIIAQLGSTYPVYVKEAFPELAIKAVSILFILDSILIVLFQVPLSNFHGRFNSILVMGSGAFLMGIGMFILSISSTFLFAIISCCIWTTGEMLFIPTAQLLCYENSEKSKKGQSIGLFQSTYAIATVVGPTLGGVMYVHAGVNSIWYLSLMIGTICLLGCIYIRKTLNKTSLLTT